MQRKKILWLVSWYPNKNDAFDGDFVQRHARAAAIFHDIHVIFVAEKAMEKPIDEEWNYATGLTEQFIYFRKEEGFLARWKKQWKWRKLFQKAIAAYISKSGLPSKVHVHVPWKAGVTGLWMKNKYGSGFILSEHWGIYNESVADHFNSRPAVMKTILQRIFREASQLVVVSKFLGDGIEKITGRKIDAVIPNVVDTSLFHPQEEKYSKFTFIHVSNMVPLKNAGLILQAFHQLSRSLPDEVSLIMIGNRNDDYLRLSSEMGLLNRSVFFRGEVSYREVAEEVRRSHCFVLFSNSETFSCVTAEALCCGLPVIASNVGALPELVDMENGILVAPGDVDALASAMKNIFEQYQRYHPGSISRKASAQFGYAAVAERFKELYGG